MSHPLRLTIDDTTLEAIAMLREKLPDGFNASLFFRKILCEEVEQLIASGQMEFQSSSGREERGREFVKMEAIMKKHEILMRDVSAAARELNARIEDVRENYNELMKI